MLLYLRWREADQARARAEETLRLAVQSTAQAEQQRLKPQQPARRPKAAHPPKREEAIAAVLQRLTVEREKRCKPKTSVCQTIEGLKRGLMMTDID